MTKIKSLIALVIIAFALTGCDMINGKKDVEVDPPAASASQVQNAIEWAQYAVKVAQSASAAAATADAKAEDAMSVAQAASAAASKCSSKCGGGKPVTPKKPYGQTKPKKPVTPAVIPAPAPVVIPTPVVVATPPAASAPCSDCKPIAELKARVKSSVCGIRVVSGTDVNKIEGLFLFQPYKLENLSADAVKYPDQVGNLWILKVDQLEMNASSTVRQIVPVKFTECSDALDYVEANWSKFLSVFKLPNHCKPKRA